MKGSKVKSSVKDLFFFCLFMLNLSDFLLRLESFHLLLIDSYF